MTRSRLLYIDELVFLEVLQKGSDSASKRLFRRRIFAGDDSANLTDRAASVDQIPKLDCNSVQLVKVLIVIEINDDQSSAFGISTEGLTGF